MVPARSCRRTFSQTSAVLPAYVNPAGSSTNPAVRNVALWQPTQYRCTVAEASARGSWEDARVAKNKAATPNVVTAKDKTRIPIPPNIMLDREHKRLPRRWKQIYGRYDSRIFPLAKVRDLVSLSNSLF